LTEHLLEWTCTSWNELDRENLYDALTLRQIVFCVEQKCPYLDCDGRDRKAFHLLGRRGGPGATAGDRMLVAYARLLPPGAMYAEASIGRVVSHPDVRRTGAGRALMREAFARSEALFGRGPIRIGAQRYLERFYGELGFVVAGEPYIEDDIPHIEMVRP
jgi:ElaA protein